MTLIGEGDISAIQKGLMEEADKKGTTRKTINYKMEVLKGSIISILNAVRFTNVIFERVVNKESQEKFNPASLIQVNYRKSPHWLASASLLFATRSRSDINVSRLTRTTMLP